MTLNLSRHEQYERRQPKIEWLFKTDSCESDSDDDKIDSYWKKSVHAAFLFIYKAC